MHLFVPFHVITNFIFLPLATPSPLDLPLNNQQHQSVNCSDLSEPFDESCWETLDLPGYLHNWNQTVAICTKNETACCMPTEPWSTCFLRLAYGRPGSDCSEINTQFCSYDSTLKNGLDPDTAPRVQYVVKNIYGA